MKSWSPPSLPSPVPGTRAILTAYDTASGAVVPIGPASGTARLYVCGITPYDATHMGHAFTYVTFDLLNRAWRDAGLDVAYTQNVTDVDDPLLERATATGVDWIQLADDQTDLFRQDMTALRVIPPKTYSGAVESIPEVIALIQRLADAGYVYQVSDEYPDWYFTTNRAEGFGDVSSYDRDQMLEVFAERGGDPDRTGKRDALDCLVWRMARDGEPSWDSPLGRGRPGWHIECTAIALETLGETFDVQGGGSDLVFPHHEMCAAEDMTALRVIPPQEYVGAVESIPEVIALIERLAAAGYVYQVDDEYADWYFTTNLAAEFGVVSSYDRAKMLEVFAERGGDPD